MAKKTSYIRNSLGRFASLKEVEKNPNAEIYEVRVGSSIHIARLEAKSKLIEAAKMGISAQDFDDNYYIVGNEIRDKRYDEYGNDTESRMPTAGDVYSNIIFNENPAWTNYNTSEKAKRKDLEAQKSTQEEFKFSYKAQTAYDLSKSEQLALYETFKQANEIMSEVIRITEGNLGYLFSYNLERKPDLIDKALDRAYSIIELGAEGYLKSQVAVYKADFLDSFHQIIYNESGDEDASEKSLLAELEEAIDLISPVQFFQLLSFSGKTSLAYALDSEVDDFGRDIIKRELKFIITRIREGDLFNR